MSATVMVMELEREVSAKSVQFDDKDYNIEYTMIAAEERIKKETRCYER